MSSDRTRVRLQDIVENADFVAEYLAGIDFETFSRDRKTRDAVERCFQRITEAVIQIGEAEVDRLGLGVPWGRLKAFGNRLRHEYRRIDQRIVFETSLNDLPALRIAAIRVLGDLG